MAKVAVGEDFDTSKNKGQSLNSISYMIYADIVVKDGLVVKCESIPSKEYPEYNAMYRPETEQLTKTSCDPVFIGDMSYFIKGREKYVKFYSIDNGYMIEDNNGAYSLSCLFDENGMMHSDIGPAYVSTSSRFHVELYATHGEFTPGKINNFSNGDLYISKGKPDTGTDVRIKYTNAEDLPDYSGPAYVQCLPDTDYILILTSNGEVYAEYPK